MFHYASYFCQDVGKGEGSDDVGSDALDFEGLAPVDVRTAHDTGGVEDMSGLEREVPFWRRPELYWKGMSWARQRVACALLMAGEDLDKNVDVKNILVEMGTYFQVQENYGKPDPENVAKVKALYNELNLQGVFEEYESGSYVKLVSSIEAHPSKAVQVVLKSFLAKIYKRQK
ncbi:hypothetical protein JHK87_055404 [Glycine soja]|nr:hypothetical protein JHK87_055404 [Glycine soja]